MPLLLGFILVEYERHIFRIAINACEINERDNQE
jgi:hypothetical protein